MLKVLKCRRSRAWLITTAAVGVVLGAVNIVALGPLNNLIGAVLGPSTPVTESGAKAYVNDYNDKKGALQHAKEITLETAREGDILLKNENNALPLKTPVTDSSITTKPKISVFGKSSVKLQYGGSGSGGADFSEANDLYSGLEKAGFDCNPKLKEFYTDNTKSSTGRPGNPTDLDSGKVITLAVGETPISMYTNDVKQSYQSDYKDAALVVFTRIGGEGFDLPRTMTASDGTVVDGAHDKDDHYLQLDQNETDLLKEVCSAGFKHVIVILNSSNPMEVGFLDDANHYAYHKEIDGCLWVGGPGSTGADAIGEILSGAVNPSGRLTDTYSRNFKNDPTWNNFSDNLMENGDRYFYMDGNNRKYQNYYFVDYEEGIYVGYRYYETRYQTESNKDEWYRNNVVYPFGYGLSYTQFEWNVVESSIPKTFKANEKMTVKVKVKNTGEIAGKDVIEIYAHAPYSTGGIEKSDEVLVGFEKTDLLKPNEEKEYSIEIDPYDFASYDYLDKNNNGFKGYELEEGNYEIRVSRNAHDHVKTIQTRLESSVKYEKDPVTGNKVENLYDDADDQLSRVLSRTNWENTWPDSPSDEERCFSGKKDEKLLALRSTQSNNPFASDSVAAPELAKMGVTTKTISETVDGQEIQRGLILKDLQGKDYDDPLWDDLLNQITFDEMVYMYDNGAFRTQAIKSIEKPLTYDSDGPVGWNNFMDTGHSIFYDTNGYTSEIVIASTWNKKLAEEVGESMGNEGIAGVEKTSKLPYTTLYAPGVNIHRSQFGGRNFEYMSEDGYLTGMMAASEIKGMQSKGLVPSVKHFALNEQETHRSLNGDISWVTEQAMREIFLKPFEKAVKVGNVKAVMSSFNRIGLTWTGGDYRLLTTILRQEWGFKGFVICDFNTCAHMDSRQMAYAGGDLNLATTAITWATDSKNAKDVAILRQATKNVLYSIANSNAMGNKIIGYIPAWWEFLIWGLDAAYVIGFGVWGFFAIKKALKPENDDSKVASE